MTHQTNTPVEITTHEEKEEQRMRRAEADYRSKEEALTKEYARALREAEVTEKAQASAELQVLSAGEIPAILEEGERSRTEAVETVEKTAQHNLPAVLKHTLAKARTQTLSL